MNTFLSRALLVSSVGSAYGAVFSLILCFRYLTLIQSNNALTALMAVIALGGLFVACLCVAGLVDSNLPLPVQNAPLSALTMMSGIALAAITAFLWGVLFFAMLMCGGGRADLTVWFDVSVICAGAAGLLMYTAAHIIIPETVEEYREKMRQHAIFVAAYDAGYAVNWRNNPAYVDRETSYQEIVSDAKDIDLT